MKMPASVMTSARMRAVQPVSPAKVPASRTRSSDCQNASSGSSRSSSPLKPVNRNTVMISAAATITASVSNPSQTMSVNGPLDNATSIR